MTIQNNNNEKKLQSMKLKLLYTKTCVRSNEQICCPFMPRELLFNVLVVISVYTF